MRDDFVFAVRLLRRYPGLYAITILGLTVAIGFATVVFAIVNAMSARHLGIHAPGRVYRAALSLSGGQPAQWLGGDVRRLLETPADFSVAAAGNPGEVRSPEPGSQVDPSVVFAGSITPVTGNYFAVLGGRARMGRVLAAADDVPGAAPVAVVSHAYWATHLAADPAILGRRLRVSVSSGEFAVTVVGVADRTFIGAVPANAGPPALWMSFTAEREAVSQVEMSAAAQQRLRLDALTSKPVLDAAEREALITLTASLSNPGPREIPYRTVLVRLSSGGTRERTQSQLAAAASAFAAERGADTSQPPAVRLDAVDERTPISIRGLGVPMLTAAVALIVALACANVMNLLLASAAGRTREIATRLALGASRARIVRQLMTESLTLSAMAGGSGLLFAWWIAPVVKSLAGVPPLLDVSLNLSVYVFVAGLTTLVGVIAGLAPARYSRRHGIVATLHGDRMAMSGAKSGLRLRSLLVAGQAAGASALLLVAALLARSLVTVSTLDLGLDVDHLITYQGIGSGYDRGRSRAYWDVALDRVRRVPGVAGAALTMELPISTTGPLRLGDGGRGLGTVVSREYFATVGTPIVRGRTFTRQETDTGAEVVIISASLARAFWHDADPIGDRLERALPAGTKPVNLRGLHDPRAAVIVGIAADRTTNLGDDFQRSTIYTAMGSASDSLVNATLLVRASVEPELVIGLVTSALRAIDPEVHHSPQLVRDSWLHQLQPARTLTALALLVGGVALTLATVGVAGVMSFMVRRRRHEVGIRMALGASRGRILTLLLNDGLRPVLVGLVFGLIAANVLARSMRTVLPGVGVSDPIAIGAAILILLGAAVVATIVPARRSAAMDPSQVLRRS